MAFSLFGHSRNRETTLTCPECNDVMLIGRG